MHSDSLLEESELSVDEQEIQRQEQTNVNDFDDLTPSDKAFFLLWNNFIREQRGFHDIKRFKNLKERVAHFTKKDNNEFHLLFVQRHHDKIKSMFRHNYVMHLLA